MHEECMRTFRLLNRKDNNMLQLPTTKQEIPA